MRRRPISLLAALLLALFLSLPLSAQIYTVPQAPNPQTTATPDQPYYVPSIPTPEPESATSEEAPYAPIWRRFFVQKPARPLRPLTGQVVCKLYRYDRFTWHYSFLNLTDHPISAVHMVVPDSLYDSRIIPIPPRGWVEERHQGEANLANKWLISWFASYAEAVMQPRGFIGAHLRSGSPLLYSDDEADIMFGGSPPDELIYPWDEDYLQVMLRPEPAAPATQAVIHGIRFPRLALNPLDGPIDLMPEAQAKGKIKIDMTGKEVHSGEAFKFVIRADHPLIARLAPGTLLLPNIPDFDDMMVGRVERVALQARDVAVFTVCTYSISYGKRPPPPRLYYYHLKYDFAPDNARPFADAYRKILQRAERLQPTLATPLGQDYPTILTQWGLWREESILEGHPLEKQALERDLQLYYVWQRTTNVQIGSRRHYLDPITVKNLANHIWAETDKLLYASPVPEQIP